MRAATAIAALAALVRSKPVIWRSMNAHHKTGVWYARDIAEQSCEVFGWGSEECFRNTMHWEERCRHRAPAGTVCVNDAPAGATRRRVIFFREPYATVVSAYLYHLGGGGGVELWTTTPMALLGKHEGHFDQVQGVKRGGLKNGFPVRRNDSLASYLGRIPIGVGLRVQMEWDIEFEVPMMTRQFVECAGARNCAVECLEWHLGAENITDRWRALSNFVKYHPEQRERFVAAVGRMHKKEDTAHLAHATSNSTARGDIDFLKRCARAFDNQYYGGKLARAPWRLLCGAPAPTRGIALAEFPKRAQAPAIVEYRRRRQTKDDAELRDALAATADAFDAWGLPSSPLSPAVAVAAGILVLYCSIRANLRAQALPAWYPK